MAEALGVAASVITVIQITGTVLSVCYDYKAAASGAPGQLSRLIGELESLRSVLQRLEPLAKQAEFAQGASGTKLPAFGQLCKPDGPLDLCSREMESLEKVLKSPSWSDKFGPRRKALVQALRWPLKEKDAERSLSVICRLKEILSFALSADDTALLLEIEKLSLSSNAMIMDSKQELHLMKEITLDVQEKLESTHNVTSRIQDGLERERLSARKKEILSWLSAPDPLTNYRRGQRSRHATTGTWFTESETFLRWLTRPNSILWLYGKAGCGKTVLSSTIITETFSQCALSSAAGVAYFFFDFRDSGKQKSGQMIRSLLAQLSSQSIESLAEVERLFVSCFDGLHQPDDEYLSSVLQAAIQAFGSVYIVVDALDECSDIDEVMDIISNISRWRLQNLHLICTSRWSAVIDESMKGLVQTTDVVQIQSKNVENDISAFVAEQLKRDPKMKRWESRPKIQEEIRSTLTKQADGMFRWVVCQLGTLQKCPNIPALRKALRSLPKTLDETYARMLGEIPEEHVEYAMTMLRWLTYALVPLNLGQIGELIAVEIVDEPWFDPDARFPDLMDLLKICSGLVQIEETSGDPAGTIVRLAHFSVKEYLASERIQTQKPSRHFIPEGPSHELIAADCVAYLLHVNEDMTSSRPGPGDFAAFPLLKYAMVTWYEHAKLADSRLEIAKPLITRFLDFNSRLYKAWCCHTIYFRAHLPPLYTMAELGLATVVRELLELGHPVNQRCANGTALGVASRIGHFDLVRLLLEHGADPNLDEGGWYNSPPLQAAAHKGYCVIVSHLLDKGAWIQYEGGTFGSALTAACAGQQFDAARLLLDRGANMPPTHEKHGTALQAACNSPKAATSLVELLLSQGVEVDAEVSLHGTALNRACEWPENDAVIRLLLSRGANPLRKDNRNGRNAIESYCAKTDRKSDIVRKLVDCGLQRNPQVAAYRNVLEVACSKGYTKIIRSIFDTQQSILNASQEGAADVTEQREFLGDLLLEACRLDDTVIMALLLTAGADANYAHGGVLNLACERGSTETLALLLKSGADPNSEHCTALDTACKLRKTEMVALLLKSGADPNRIIRGALGIACQRGDAEKVALLLHSGADPNAEYRTALNTAHRERHSAIEALLIQAGANFRRRPGIALDDACKSRNRRVVALLLQWGANPNLDGYDPLKTVCQEDNIELLALLLEYGADPNRRRCTALYTACRYGHRKAVALLLEWGADPNLNAGLEGLPLNSAITSGNPKIVKLLLDNGADVNAKSKYYGVKSTVCRFLILIQDLIDPVAFSEMLRLIYRHNPVETGLSPDDIADLAISKQEAGLTTILKEEDKVEWSIDQHERRITITYGGNKYPIILAKDRNLSTPPEPKRPRLMIEYPTRSNAKEPA